MGAIDGSEFGGLFNSALEAGIRAVIVLEHMRPEALDLAEMVLFDHVVVHTADLGGPPSLHPEVPGRKGELLVRRRLVEASLELMQRCHLIDQESADEGILPCLGRSGRVCRAANRIFDADEGLRAMGCRAGEVPYQGAFQDIGAGAHWGLD